MGILALIPTATIQRNDKATYVYLVVPPSPPKTDLTVTVRNITVGTIEGDDAIRLKVAPEVSSLDYTNSVTINGFIMPAIQTRRAETEIELKNGQSFGIAGLLDHRTTALLSKIPGIGDVPVLGKLFHSKSINKSVTELMVLVTPVIVDPVGGVGAPPKLPPLAMPLLDTPKFDQSLGNKAQEPNNKTQGTSPATSNPK